MKFLLRLLPFGVSDLVLLLPLTVHGFNSQSSLSSVRDLIKVGAFIVDLRINETLQTGSVREPHLPGDESVYLFFEFTINDPTPVCKTLRCTSDWLGLVSLSR